MTGVRIELAQTAAALVAFRPMGWPLLQSTFLALRSLWKGALDEHRTSIILRAALAVAIVSAIASLAFDPVIRDFASMAGMQSAVDPNLRERILSVWAGTDLLRRGHVFLWIDLLLQSPACLLLLVAFLHTFNSRSIGEGAPPAFLRWRLRWGLLLAVPVLAFIAGVVGDVLSLYALSFARAGATHFPAWLHIAILALYWAALALYGLSVGVALWVFGDWYFRSSEDSDGGLTLANAAARQARLRAAIADMAWRSKYALAILLLFAAIVLLMDQTRDALLRQIVDVGSASEGQSGPLATLVGFVTTLFALFLLARASWLWPRLILRLRSPGSTEAPAAAHAFAKWWCRSLGLAPFLLVAIMFAETFHDVPWNVSASPAIPWLLLALALIAVAAFFFLYRVAYRLPAGAPGIGYYQFAANAAEARQDMGRIPVIVAWGAPVAFLLARYLGLMQWTPPLALAVISAALATWAGALGWVAYESRRFAVPYLWIFAALVGVLGVLDLTDANRMRLWTAGAGQIDARTLQRLFAVTAALLALSLAVAWYWSRKSTTGVGRLVSGVAAILAVITLVKLNDGGPAVAANPPRPALNVALKEWIVQLPAAAWKPADAADDFEPYPVFLIATEGGGIRSAYWTALVLWRMKYGLEDFERRTFALAGVSGGALGLAVYRACASAAGAKRETVKACIDRFGYSDLWTQLLGGMFFEDIVATVVPTRFCHQPGCGALGRSYWFEGALETAVPELAGPLATPVDAHERLAHLLLTTTRVESGERAIESDLQISTEDFPDAIDLLNLAQADIRLSTAAHNSSRFPFTNPVGALYGPGCPQDPRNDDKASRTGRTGLCARLQDGGYYDDSAAETAADLLSALYGCLREPTCSANRDGGTLWIKPVVIEIRNEDPLRVPPDQARPTECSTPGNRPYNPALPENARPQSLYPSILSAPLTLYNTRAAHLRNFEGELERDAEAGWASLRLMKKPNDNGDCTGGLPRWIGDHPVHRFDLVDDGTLYPSGWLLSTKAMQGVCEQARQWVAYSDPAASAAECVPSLARNR